MKKARAAKESKRGPQRTVPVRVNARILRHVSRGIYRSPAAALKELVSNAHDARAKSVSISTGYPTFDAITITDNGDGMLSTEFETLIQRIGFSNKVAGQKIKVPGALERRTIGHYGIGFLAAGQLAGTMVVTSKKAGDTLGFRAEFNFDQFESAKSGEDDDVEETTLTDEYELERQDKKSGEKKFAIGTCKIRDLEFAPADKGKHFTRIELTGVRADVRKKLKGKLSPGLKVREGKLPERKYSASFDDLLRLIREREGLLKQGQYPYEKLLWELAVYCPVAYPKIGAFAPGGELHSFYQRSIRAQFSVSVDGFNLTKPYEKHFFEDKEYPIHKIWQWKNESYLKLRSHDCTASAFVILKQRVRPKILQGVLIREAETAVGLFDPTFMEYPFNEGYKFNYLTAEIFSEGLSGALNIDRNSFNQTDDAYLALADWFHEKLNSLVFPTFKRLQKGPRGFKREKNKQEVEQLLDSQLAESGAEVREVSFRALGKKNPLFKISGKVLFINKDHRDGRGSSALKEKVVLAASLVARSLIGIDQLESILSEIERARKRVQRMK